MESILLDINVASIGNKFLVWLQDIAVWLVQLLPLSPFRRVIDTLDRIPYMYAIKWFVPIDEAILILMYWGTAIGLYYGYMIVLRWIKAIE